MCGYGECFDSARSGVCGICIFRSRFGCVHSVRSTDLSDLVWVQRTKPVVAAADHFGLKPSHSTINQRIRMPPSHLDARCFFRFVSVCGLSASKCVLTEICARLCVGGGDVVVIWCCGVVWLYVESIGFYSVDPFVQSSQLSVSLSLSHLPVSNGDRLIPSFVGPKFRPHNRRLNPTPHHKPKTRIYLFR